MLINKPIIVLNFYHLVYYESTIALKVYLIYTAPLTSKYIKTALSTTILNRVVALNGYNT